MRLVKGLLTVFGPHSLCIRGPSWLLIALKACTFSDLCLTRLKINLWVCLSQSMCNNRAAMMWHFGWVSSSKKPAFCALPQIPKGISACQVSFDMTGRRWASRESQQTQDGCAKWRDPSTLWIRSWAPHYAGNHKEIWDKRRDKGHVISEYEAFRCTRMDIWLLATSPVIFLTASLTGISSGIFRWEGKSLEHLFRCHEAFLCWKLRRGIQWCLKVIVPYNNNGSQRRVSTPPILPGQEIEIQFLQQNAMGKETWWRDTRSDGFETWFIPGHDGTYTSSLESLCSSTWEVEVGG